MMQFPFGPQIASAPPVGPVPQIDLPSGFRPPGLAMGGAPGMPQQQGMQLGVPYIPGLGGRTGSGYDLNKDAVRTAGDRDMNGYGGSPVDPFGNPNAQPSEVFNPTGAVKAPGVTITETGGMQPRSNFWDIFPKLGGGGGDSFLSPSRNYP